MDNPRAFPVWINDSEYTNGGYVDGGMSLRDYFAAKAMHALAEETNATATDYIDGLAQLSYKYADALLKARGK
jgi:hypothetical protein